MNMHIIYANIHYIIIFYMRMYKKHSTIASLTKDKIETLSIIITILLLLEIFSDILSRS